MLLKDLPSGILEWPWLGPFPRQDHCIDPKQVLQKFLWVELQVVKEKQIAEILRPLASHGLFWQPKRSQESLPGQGNVLESASHG